MKRALLLAVVVMLGTNCARRASTGVNISASAKQNATLPVQSATLTSASDGRVSTETDEVKEVAAGFERIDFKNLSYPVSFRKGSIRLEGGSYEYRNPDYTGGDSFDFEDVYYADLTGDGKKEAIVQLNWIGCGVSCDGGSQLFYVYTVLRNRPSLLWRFETGSAAYGCGLKSLTIKGRVTTLEVFGNCRFRGAVIGGGGDGAKFVAEEYTRFVHNFDGRRFAQVKREVFKNPNPDVRGYSSQISISDD